MDVAANLRARPSRDRAKLAGMTLDELRRTIFDSEPEQWHDISCWGGGGSTGPAYLDQLSPVTVYDDGQPSHRLEVRSHTTRATYRPDISIGLAWGLSDPEDQRKFAWNKFPDAEECYPTLVDLLWNGSLVDRHVGLVVDGGRVTIPFPKVDYDSSDPANPVATEWFDGDQVKLFCLVHTIPGTGYDFDDYVARTGLPTR